MKLHGFFTLETTNFQQDPGILYITKCYKKVYFSVLGCIKSPRKHGAFVYHSFKSHGYPFYFWLLALGILHTSSLLLYAIDYSANCELRTDLHTLELI